MSSVKFHSTTGLTSVTCVDGFTAITNHLVVSVAPQLAVRSIAFSPSLPVNQMNLFTSIIGGHAVKVIMVFRHAFWLHQSHQMYNPERKSSIKKIPVGSELLDINVCSSSFSRIFPFQNERHFIDLGFMHNIFHGEVGEFPALVGLITGDAALEFERIKDAEERKRLILKQIKDIYSSGAPVSEAPVSDDPQLYSPLSYSEMAWASDEYSGGCFAGVLPPTGIYSAFASQYLQHTPIPTNSLLSAVTTDESNNDNYEITSVPISTPKPQPNLSLSPWIHWATTETSRSYYGYIEGAARAGLRAANDILSDCSSCNHTPLL